ncbi:MAG: LruC domain-containing protein [Prevotella sp.]|nr:LruC domain-containing protein [Prevotella sp.]
MNKNAKFLIGLACLSLGITACKDDYFDQEKYDYRLKQSFPVEDVDPNHTWAIYGSATLNATVNGDYGKKYRVDIYQENPLYISPVTLLASSEVITGQNTTLFFSYKLAQPTVYIACFDENNRRIIKTKTVTNGEDIHINFFGESGSASRAVPQDGFFESQSYGMTRTTRADEPMAESGYVKASESQISLNDWVNPSWRSHVTIDLSTIGTSNEFNTITENALNKNEVANDNRANKWWRVESNISLSQNLNGDQNTLNKAVVYVKSGTLTLSADYTGVTFIVGNGATLALSGERRFGQGARIVVMEGGTLTTTNNVTFSGKAESVGFYNAGTAKFVRGFDMSNVSVEQGATLYNVGTLNISSLTNVRYLYNYGTLNIHTDFTVPQNKDHSVLHYNFYNEGTMTVPTATVSEAVNYGTLNGTSLIVSDNYYFNAGTSEFKTIKVKQLSNTGHLTFEENLDDRNERWTLNACYLHITKSQTASTGFRRLVMLRNSRLDMDGDMYFQESNNSYMEDKSLVNVGGKFVVPNDGACMYAPTAEGEFAILKIAGNIEMAKWCAMIRPNNGQLYLDWAHAADGVSHSTIANKENYSDQEAVTQMTKTMASALITESTAPSTVRIPKAVTASDCTGAGYNTTTTTVPDIQTKTSSFRICFEDQFPSPGDYDFNDCVLTVTSTVKGKNVTVKVSLDAIGASKQLAAAMRIKGLSPDAIVSAANTFTDHAATYASMRFITPCKNDKGNTLYYVDPQGLGLDADGNQITDFVVSLFNDAHWAMSRTDAGGNNQYMHSYFYNTVDKNITNNLRAKVADPVEMTLTFTLDTEANAQLFNDVSKYDVFIVERYNGREWEVHTYPYKFDQVIAQWANYVDKLTHYKESSTSNYPWAIQVPGDFLYPIEWQSISGSKIQTSDTEEYGVETAAYKLFKSWAVNPNTEDKNVQEWYLKENIEDLNLVWQ